jgi:hypothetical protein
MIGKAIYLLLGFAYPCAFCASFPREKVSSHRLEPLILSLSHSAFCTACVLINTRANRSLMALQQWYFQPAL